MIDLKIENVIGQLDDEKHRVRDWDSVEGFMVHRCGVDLKTGVVLGYDAVRIGEAFIGRRPEWDEVARATGYQNPYTLYVGGDLGPPSLDGKIWQALPIDEVGYHGRRYSFGHIGIGCIADPRVKPMSRPQYNSLTSLLAALCVGWAKDPYRAIRGHGEVPGSHDGSKAPDEPAACPGLTQRELNVLRDDVADLVKYEGRSVLHAAGLIFA